MKSRAACHDGSPSVQKPMPSMVAVRRGTSGDPEHERAVVAAEAEGIVHRVAQAARSRVVEMYLRAAGRVAGPAVQLSRPPAAFDRNQHEHRLEAAGSAPREAASIHKQPN